MKIAFISVLSLLWTATSFCADAKPRIIDGFQVNLSDYPSVALILFNDTVNGITYKGSGTLITKRHVLTAGHVANGKGGMTGTVGINGIIYNVASLAVHPSYLLNPDSAAAVEGRFDMGIITLSEDVPDVAPSPIVVTGPDVGAFVDIVGFGKTRTSDNFGPYLMYHGLTSYEQVDSTHVFWKFDAFESNTAEGDSGGPAFVTVNGERCISTITEGGEVPSENLGVQSWNTRIDSQSSWIESVTGEPVQKRALLTASPGKGSYSVNLSKSNLDTLTLTITATDLIGQVLPLSQNAVVNIGGTRLDVVPMVFKSGSANGKLVANTHNGQLKYTLHKASLLNALQSEGVSSTTTLSKKILFYIGIDGKFYGGAYDVVNTVRPGKTIKGKF